MTLFTFHNVSINSTNVQNLKMPHSYLHSTMFLLIRSQIPCKQVSSGRHLHSTMFLLIPVT